MKNLKTITRVVILILSAAISSTAFSQGNSGAGTNNGQGQGVTRWKLNGNVGTGNEFIGTINQQELILKSGDEIGLKIKPNRDMEIPGQIYVDQHRPIEPGEENIMIVDYNGKVKSLSKSGLLQAIYAKQPDCDKGGQTYPAPIWNNEIGINGPGILYTADECPGKVGIGTSNPLGVLDVRGTTFIKGRTTIGNTPNYSAQLYVQQEAPGADGLTVEFLNSSNFTSGIGINTIVNQDERRAMVVHNAVSEKDVFRVYGNGVVYATEVNVRIEDEFPDYVFKTDYELLDLENLRNFIDTHGKLPNLPSAEQVKEEGIALGEMNRLLVEKVEELTLYILELEKRLKIVEDEK